MTAKGFDAVEYTVFGVMISFSVVIGIYHGFFRKGQDTVDQYLLGGKKMGLLPISVSLICSFISEVALLGIPTEVYTHGSQFMIVGLSFASSALIAIFFILPVFYKLQMVSVFKYLELRFGPKVRRFASFLYILNMILFIPIVIYGSALALNQVCGLPVHLVTVTVSVICIFYTTIGGLTAVVWADTLQGVVMVLAMIVIAAITTFKLGGLSAILQAAEDSDRLEMFEMQLDPRHRNTFWSVSFGIGVLYLSILTTNPSYMQRFIALPSLREAQWSACNWGIGSYFFVLFSGYFGLCAYAKYKDCDPLKSGAIKRPDQLLPLLIVDVVSDIKGLLGLFIAGIVCAALSSMSTFINTVAGTIYADFLEPWLGQTTGKRASNIMKLLSLGFGIISVLMVLLVEKSGAILQLNYAVTGLTNGTALGVYILGLFFPKANSKGASVGSLCSLLIMAWIITGAHYAVKSGDIVFSTKRISVKGCNKTISLNSTLTEESFHHVFPLFAISFYYYAPLGALLVILIGLPVSYVTGSKEPEDINKDLLSPFVHKYLPTYSAVSTNESELRNIT